MAISLPIKKSIDYLFLHNIDRQISLLGIGIRKINLDMAQPALATIQ